MVEARKRTVPKNSAQHSTTSPAVNQIVARNTSLGRRAVRLLARLVVVFCLVAIVTFAWETYGAATRAVIASSWPQLAWLSADAAPPAPTASSSVGQAVPTPAPELQQIRGELLQFTDELEQLSSAIAGVWQDLEQLAARVQQNSEQSAADQQQMTAEIAKLSARQKELAHKLSAAQPRAASAAAPGPRAARAAVSQAQ